MTEILLIGQSILPFKRKNFFQLNTNRQTQIFEGEKKEKKTDSFAVLKTQSAFPPKSWKCHPVPTGGWHTIRNNITTISRTAPQVSECPSLITKTVAILYQLWWFQFCFYLPKTKLTLSRCGWCWGRVWAITSGQAISALHIRCCHKLTALAAEPFIYF